MLSHMSLLASVVSGLLGLSACGLSIETAYDMVVVYIYIYIIRRRRIGHYVMSYLSSGIAFYTVFWYIRRVTSQCAWRHRTNKKSNTSKRQQQHDILRGLIFPKRQETP